MGLGVRFRFEPPSFARYFFGHVLPKEGLCYREFPLDGLPQLDADIRTYVKLVEIYAKARTAPATW